MGGMEQMVESHAYRDEPYVDGRHSGSLALIGGVGKLSGIHLRKTPLISAKYLTFFTLKMEFKAQHKGLKPEYVCKNRGNSVVYRCRDWKEQ